jgi:hypothetical protein
MPLSQAERLPGTIDRGQRQVPNRYLETDLPVRLASRESRAETLFSVTVTSP